MSRCLSGKSSRPGPGISFSGNEAKPLFKNTGQGFVEIGTTLGASRTEDGRGFVLVDLDGDGTLDVVMHNFYRNPIVALANRAAGENRWLRVRLRGTTSNRFGIGARVVATCRGRRQAQEMVCGSGYLSSPPPELVFALPESCDIFQPCATLALEIAWPGGGREWVEVGPGRIAIEEGRGVVSHAPHARPAPPPVPAPERVVREGDVVTAVPAETLDGAPLDWGAYRGKPLVLLFWSAYCKSCEADDLRAAAAELKRVDPALELISLNVDGERARLAEMHDRKPFSVKPAVAIDGARGFVPSNDPVVPLVLVVDAQGRVRARHVGAQSPRELAALTRRALR